MVENNASRDEITRHRDVKEKRRSVSPRGGRRGRSRLMSRSSSSSRRAVGGRRSPRRRTSRSRDAPNRPSGRRNVSRSRGRRQRTPSHSSVSRGAGSRPARGARGAREGPGFGDSRRGRRSSRSRDRDRQAGDRDNSIGRSHAAGRSDRPRADVWDRRQERPQDFVDHEPQRRGVREAPRPPRDRDGDRTDRGDRDRARNATDRHDERDGGYRRFPPPSSNGWRTSDKPPMPRNREWPPTRQDDRQTGGNWATTWGDKRDGGWANRGLPRNDWGRQRPVGRGERPQDTGSNSVPIGGGRGRGNHLQPPVGMTTRRGQGPPRLTDADLKKAWGHDKFEGEDVEKNEEVPSPTQRRRLNLYAEKFEDLVVEEEG